jgi:hypothetical protein
MPAPCVTWFEFDLHHRVAPSHDRAIADDPLSNSEGVGVSLSPAECCLHGRQGMEHLWSRAVATGGNRWQMGLPRKRLEQAKTVAMGCDQLPGPQNGKEGVSGSSPSEALQKPRKSGRFPSKELARAPVCGGMAPSMELSDPESASGGRDGREQAVRSRPRRHRGGCDRRRRRSSACSRPPTSREARGRWRKTELPSSPVVRFDQIIRELGEEDG